MKPRIPIPEPLCITIVLLCLLAQLAFGLAGAWLSSFTMAFVMSVWFAYVFFSDEDGEPPLEELIEMDYQMHSLELVFRDPWMQQPWRENNEDTDER